jgi:hypothetical protein
VPIQGLSLEGSLSPSLATASVAVAATDNVNGYQFQMSNVWDAMQTRMRGGYAQLGSLPSADPITAQARQAQANAAGLSSALASVGTEAPPAAQAIRPTAAASRRASSRSRGCSPRRTPRAITCRCAA